MSRDGCTIFNWGGGEGGSNLGLHAKKAKRVPAFFFFLLYIFTQDYPLGWVPLQMRGPARNIAQTYKNNIYTKHDMYNYKNIYTGLYTWVD